MSFDLMVFDPALVKYQEREAFIEWYYQTTEWDGTHDYNDLGATSEPLRKWMADITIKYPSMNGPFAIPVEEIDDANLADYSISPDSVYVSFAWSDALGGRKETVTLAEKYGLGVFDASGLQGAVWAPDETGKLVRVH
jgi:hypothetical protein